MWTGLIWPRIGHVACCCDDADKGFHSLGSNCRQCEELSASQEGPCSVMLVQASEFLFQNRPMFCVTNLFQ